jgi:phosphoribosylformylglycinamidine synthase
VTDPIALRGGPALPPFRQEILLRAIQAATPDAAPVALEATHVFFLELAHPLTDETLEKVRALLQAAHRMPLQTREGFLVTPRKGTISPWSSKATDIFRNCGLDEIQRVERGVHYRIRDAKGEVLDPSRLGRALFLLHDRMTEGVYQDVSDIFRHRPPQPLRTIPVRREGIAALERANREMGLALNEAEIAYLYALCQRLERDPTDVELMMFAQVNSEHCRHKIFRASWTVDGVPHAHSLFDMIRHTHRLHPGPTRLAYRDNAAVLEGWRFDWFRRDPGSSRRYAYEAETLDILIKVETHNHPTAISPYPGAATGIGGEIRDEGATGRGGKTKAGLCAFLVSNLRIPGFEQPWETEWAPFPARFATPLQIMTEGPLGGAGFGNEFGRPLLTGLFRTFETLHEGRLRGYHKPIMAAGGIGAIRRGHIEKQPIPPGALILQIGGPALRIGLGGGAASSMDGGANLQDLDFDSVQRDNAEMQRRAQEVLDACMALGPDNPILSIHDVGAGGLSNACPELVAPDGAVFHLRRIPNQEPSMSPMEIWCCEAQERYVLAIAPEHLERFTNLCRRERCPVAVIGEARSDGRLILEDPQFGNRPIDLPMKDLLGNPPRMHRIAERPPPPVFPPWSPEGIAIEEAVRRVLHFPAVAAKTFLITIADRTVTGLVARDQMVGPWQMPVADAAVTLASYRGYAGEAMAMGERTPVALLHPAASGRLAVGEALTNLASTPIPSLDRVVLSANWMCACGEPGEDAALFDTVRAVALELCPALGLCIPVGKDSLSMRALWTDNQGRPYKMTAPLSLLISAFGPVEDARLTLTPRLVPRPDTSLVLLDLGRKANRMGGSVLCQVFQRPGGPPPDLDAPADLVAFFAATRELMRQRLVLAYHDRSDGGLFVTLAEMAFASNLGLDIRLDPLGDEPLSALFSEELGAVLQVADPDLPRVSDILRRHRLCTSAILLGKPIEDRRIVLRHRDRVLFEERVAVLKRGWWETTYQMQQRRDHPETAREELAAIEDETDPGLTAELTFDPTTVPAIVGSARPRVAILREQGINGHVEMAAAFERVGFDPVDVHMTDLLSGADDLSDYSGLVVCGGFSYGDVLGAGSGWARSILFNSRLRDLFSAFFQRPNTFTLGVCNGCQMLSQLKMLIPGAELWPRFIRNRCQQFEARLVKVEVLDSPSLFLRGMAGSFLPIPVAHGEGQVAFESPEAAAAVQRQGLLALRYVDHRNRPTEIYPYNPNGSPGGMTGFTTPDGRATILMPHPERAFRSIQLSYAPPPFAHREEGPWLRFFQNARAWVAGH